jgi:LPXTG-motif cell wall-anchored protein
MARKLLIGAGIAVASLSGGVAAAADYPPSDPPPTTVLATSDSGGSRPQGFQRPTEALAETGSDTGALVLIAGGAVATGVGLLVVARRRRQPAAS